MSDELDIGDLSECPCSQGTSSDLAGSPMRYVKRRPPTPKKARSKGQGSFCVLSHKGKVVHCYESETTAKRVADAFTKRGRAGTKFVVKPR